MNKRQRQILDDLAASAERTAAAREVIAAEQRACIKLVVRGRTAKIDTVDLATAAGVEAVTVRQWVRRDRIANEATETPADVEP